jgi:ABC-2 type transport system permease protein
MKRFLKLTKAMFLIHIRNRNTLFWNLAFPIFILVIYALIFGNMSVGDQDYMTWVVPGVLVFNILAFGLLGSAALMVQMREKFVLRRLQASPVPTGQLVGSYLVVNVLIGVLQCVLILVFAALVFKASFSITTALLAFPMILLGILCFVALGQVISGLAATAGVAVAVGQIINFSQMFITDLVMPLEMMPDWIQKIAPYLPAYAVVQLVRPPLVDGSLSPEMGTNLLVVFVYIALAALLASRLFRWEPRS